MIFWILTLIGLIGLVLASYFDIKTKEVPNIISFSMIALGLGLRLIYSIITKNEMFFRNSLLIVSVFFILGGILYVYKKWGGADTKILMALGALFYPWSTPYFLVSFLIIFLLVASVYGFIWAAYVSIKHKEEFKKTFVIIYKKKKTQTIILFFVFLLLFVISLIVSDISLRFVLMLLAILSLLYHYLWIFTKAVEKSCMEKTVPVSKLVEGDWIIGEIKKGNKVLYPKDLPLITKNHISLFKKYGIKEVRIREGFAFIPVFLITLVITLFFDKVFLTYVTTLL
ncbi:MAG: A24 family peptidase [Candidatus Nanoarchaeia archaeon]|nr:A24 family peptidase [Candidatus Nanoarchaeia archaeon]